MNNSNRNHNLSNKQLTNFEGELTKEGFFWQTNNENYLFSDKGEIYFLRSNYTTTGDKTVGKWYFNREIGTLQIAWNNSEQLEIQIEKVDNGFNKITYTGKLNEIFREHSVLTKMKILDDRFDNFLKADEIIQNIPEGAVKGDFDGNGNVEFAWITKDENKPEDCLEDCGCIVKFSDKSMDDFVLEQPCMYAYLANQGDLNNNGRDELSITSTGFGTWGGINVFYFNGSKWKMLVETISYWSEGEIKDFIQKDETNPGYVIIKEYDTNFDIISKSVPVY